MARSLAPKGQLWQDHEQADPFQSSPSRVACPATSCPLRNAVSVLSYTRYVDASFRTARCQKSVVKKVNREMICKRTEDGNRFKAKTKVLRKRPGTKLSPKDAKRSYLPRCDCLKDYQMNTPVVQEVLPRSLTGLAQECGGRYPGEGRREEENGGCKRMEGRFPQSQSLWTIARGLSPQREKHARQILSQIANWRES